MADKNLARELYVVQRFWGGDYVFSPLGDGHVNNTFLARQKGEPKLAVSYTHLTLPTSDLV